MKKFRVTTENKESGKHGYTIEAVDMKAMMDKVDNELDGKTCWLPTVNNDGFFTPSLWAAAGGNGVIDTTVTIKEAK